MLRSVDAEAPQVVASIKPIHSLVAGLRRTSPMRSPMSRAAKSG
jgi:hypothetical protein